MYTIVYSRTALRALRRMPSRVVTAIQKGIAQLAQNPHDRGGDVRKLRGREGFRLRIGDYRVIYILDDDKLVLLVVKVGTRGSVYVQDTDDRD